MSWAWSRTFYAEKDGQMYNFEAKRNRDDAVKNYGFVKVPSAEAWKRYPNITRIEWRAYERWKAFFAPPKEGTDMSLAYPCVYCTDGKKCTKFSDAEITSWCVLGPCEYETPSNADRIRTMTDEELAFYIVNHPMWSDTDACVAWLKQGVDNG